MFPHIRVGITRALHCARTRRSVSCYATAFLGLASAAIYTSRLHDSIHADISSDDQEDFEQRRATMVAPGGREEDALVSFNRVYHLGNETGISRYDFNAVPITQVAEDNWWFLQCNLPTHSWTFFGIFDGHNGADASAFLSTNLIYALVGSLADLYSSCFPSSDPDIPTPPSSIRPYPPASLVDATIKETFLRLDSEIVSEAAELALASDYKNASKNYLAPACSGSSALVSFFESDSRLLRVALTGHSHAVLGRRAPKLDSTGGRQTYEVHPLTSDRNTEDMEEGAQKEKTASSMVGIRRMLGGLVRIFGDGIYKWDMEVKRKLKERGLCDCAAPFTSDKPIPQLTAEPEIITTKVQSGDFLIMASHGFWDCLTDEEAVGLVGVWLEKNKVTDCPGAYWDQELEMLIEIGYRPPKDPSETIVEREQLPVTLDPEATAMYNRWKTKKRFINIDSNAAVHLSRNALGGADRDLTAALLNMDYPHSTRLRDDITIYIVFFD